VSALDKDLLAAKTRLRAKAKHDRETQRAHEDGRMAYCAGIPRTGCTARKASKRNAWLMDWDEAQRQTEEYQALKAMPAEQKAAIRARLGAIKAELDGAT
jgi:ribosome modulation factor